MRPSAVPRRARRIGGRHLLGFLCTLGFVGCTTPRTRAPFDLPPAREEQRDAFRRAHRTLAGLFPPAYRATQRAVIDFGRRHYVCDGFLWASPEAGLHLAVVSAFGVVTEVRVKEDGTPEVLKTTALFRESWTREYVSRDLRWLCMAPKELEAVGTLPDGRLVLESRPDAGGVRARYVFSPEGSRWEGLELRRGGRGVYHATVRRWGRLGGWPAEVPVEIEVDAGVYRLNLRIAAWDVLGAAAASAAGGPGL